MGEKEVAGSRDGERRGSRRAWRTEWTTAGVWLRLVQPRLYVSVEIGGVSNDINNKLLIEPTCLLVAMVVNQSVLDRTSAVSVNRLGVSE